MTVAIAERVLPHDVEAERALLGSALLDAGAWVAIAGVLVEGDLYRDAHRKIFRAMALLFERGVPIDLVPLRDVLRTAGELDECGGPAYISALVDGVPRSANVGAYAAIVKEKARLRGLIFAANRIAESAYDGEDGSGAIVDAGTRALLEQAGTSGGEPIDAQTAARAYVAALDPAISGGAMATGLTDLDEQLAGGFRTKNLYIIAGRPGCLSGETSIYYKRGMRWGRTASLSDLYRKFNGLSCRDARNYQSHPIWDLSLPTFLQSFADDGVLFYNKIVAVYASGVRDLIRLELDGEQGIRPTVDHLFLTPNGYVPAGDLAPGNVVIAKGPMLPVSRGGRDQSASPPRIIVNTRFHPYGSYKNTSGYEYMRVPRARLVIEAHLNGLPYDEFVHALKHNGELSASFRFVPTDFEVHHDDENTLNDELGNLVVLSKVEHARLHGKYENFGVEPIRELTVVKVEPAGNEMTYDIQMEGPANNFCANGLVVHNSGKSSLGLGIALGLARHGTPAAYFSVEMNAQELGGRLVSWGARIDQHRMVSGWIGEQDYARISTAVADLGGVAMVIQDTAASVTEIAAWCHRLVADRGIRCAVVDYLQMLLPERRSKSREEDVAGLARGLKGLAKREDLAVIALSALNRAPEGRRDNRPRLSDMRESGSIEYDADAALLLFRQDQYEANDETHGIAEVIFAKNRTGPTGTVRLAFIESLGGQFQSLAPLAG